MTTLESAQGTLVKGFCDISKRSHHTRLLEALDVSKVRPLIYRSCANLYGNIFKVDSPARDLNVILYAKFLSEGLDSVKGTLLHRTLLSGFSPVKLMMGGRSVPHSLVSRPAEDGAVDSLRCLLRDESYGVKDSPSHRLVKLLLRH